MAMRCKSCRMISAILRSPIDLACECIVALVDISPDGARSPARCAALFRSQRLVHLPDAGQEFERADHGHPSQVMSRIILITGCGSSVSC